MPTFTGKFQLASPEGSIVQESPCRVSFEAETLTLARGVQWRLAEIGAVGFDEQNYTVRLESGGAHLVITKPAKA